MRKSALRSLLPQCRCLSLLFIVLLTVLGAESLYGSDRDGQSSARVERQERLQLRGAGGVPYEKIIRLNNACSDGNLRVRLCKKPCRKVDALGNSSDEFAKLVMSSAPDFPGGVRIRGYSVDKYLCFNKKGRLKARHNGDSRKCVFKEEIERNFIKLRSIVRPEWYMGFRKKNGRALPGYKAARKLQGRCTLFVKIAEDARTPAPPSNHGPMGNLDLNKFRGLFRKSNRHRNNHRHRHHHQAPSPSPPVHSVGPLPRPQVDFIRFVKRNLSPKR